MSQTTQITKADVHCYTKNGVIYVTPKASIARLRDDNAKPVVLGKLVHTASGWPMIKSL
jgi:hypothetical protein